MTKQKAGRTNKYDTHVAPKLELIAHWCKQGATEEEICKKLDVGVSTFNKYKKEHPELKDVLFLGKQDADDKVEAALFKKALGYDYEERKVKQTDDGTEVTVTTKHIPPDSTAMIFWLKNRRPNDWKDRREISTDEDSSVKVVIVNDLPT